MCRPAIGHPLGLMLGVLAALWVAGVAGAAPLPRWPVIELRTVSIASASDSETLSLGRAPRILGDELFARDADGSYLCPRSIVQRTPERCPPFGPGVREVRVRGRRGCGFITRVRRWCINPDGNERRVEHYGPVVDLVGIRDACERFIVGFLRHDLQSLARMVACAMALLYDPRTETIWVGASGRSKAWLSPDLAHLLTAVH
ncbi:MAG: hypothetical protein ACP5HS_06820 [Anaerolineae bacterium]